MERKERFILKNKAAFKKRYGADWERVLYATANKQFNEEGGAGEWGTDKLTNKYKKDTPGQEETVVKKKKIVLRKRIDEASPPSGPKNPNKPHVKKPTPWHLKDTPKLVRDKPRYSRYTGKSRRGMVDDEGYRSDGSNPVDDAIRRRNAARRRAAARNEEITVGEELGIAEGDKSEYSKLMDKYGDMPMSKVPMKARLRIRELGRKVRGDKGGPTAGDLVKNMKRRRMGEEVEQVDEAVDGWIAMYNGKKVEIKKSEAKDLYAAKLKAIQMLKVPKSKQGLLAIKPAVHEEVERVDESEYGSIGDRVKRKLRKPGGLADRHDNRVARKSSSPEKRDGAVQRMADRRGKRGPMDHDSSKWHSDEKLRSKVRKSAGVNEEVEQVDEVKKGAIASAARKGMPPYTIVAIQGLNPPKVVAQETTMIASAVPAHVKEMKSKYPKAKISVEGKSGKILHTEQIDEAGMIGRTKPSRELNVQKFEKKYLGTKSLKDAKRAAHKAERKKGKQDVKINPTVDENVDAAKERVAQAKQRVMLAKQRLARSKARDLGNKRRKMANEAIKPAATLKDSGRQVVQTTAGRFQQKTLKKQAERSSQQAGRTQSRTSELAKKIKRRMRRKLRRPTTNR